MSSSKSVIDWWQMGWWLLRLGCCLLLSVINMSCADCCYAALVSCIHFGMFLFGCLTCMLNFISLWFYTMKSLLWIIFRESPTRDISVFVVCVCTALSDMHRVCVFTAALCMTRCVCPSCRPAVCHACVHFICGSVLAVLCYCLLYSHSLHWWLLFLHDFMFVGKHLVYFLLEFTLLVYTGIMYLFITFYVTKTVHTYNLVISALHYVTLWFGMQMYQA